MGANVPVLVGPVPLLYVQSMTIDEGYEIQPIMGSRFLQATQPTKKQIGIEALLIGPERFGRQKALEAVALTSRLLVATASALLPSGIPVVSGLAISLDMQITKLRFVQSVARRDALDVSIVLLEVPRSSLTAVVGEVADLLVGAGTALIPGSVAPNPIARTVSELF